MKWPSLFSRKNKTPEPLVRNPLPRGRSRGYQAADSGRLLADWITQNQSANATIRQSLKVLRARSRDLVINDDYASRFIDLVGDNVTGPDGVRLQVRSRDGDKLDKFANDKIEAAWAEWSKRGVCTVDGRLSWVDAQRQIIQTIAKDGELLIRHIRGRSAGNKFNYAIQILEADYLSEDKTHDRPNVEMGVELNDFKRPTGYYFYTGHPGSDVSTAGQRTVRLPASDILHPYIVSRPEQVRGVPWMAPAMFRLKMLSGYEEAEVVAARMAASKMGFFETETPEGYQGDGLDADGNTVTEMEPGIFEQLPPGVKFTEYNPTHPTTQFKDFVKGVLRGASSGMGVSYNTLANDLEGVNYSSLRQGALNERDQWRSLQTWFIGAVVAPIFEEWLLAYLSSGLTTLPPRKYDKFNTPVWSPRGWAWVDPAKEVTAATAAIDAGLKSKTEVMAEQGRDFQETLDVLASEKELEEAAGLAAPAPAPPPPPGDDTEDEDNVDEND